MLICVLCSFAALAFAADYTTYIGGANVYHAAAIATAPNGDTYITGSRDIAPPLTDVFVSKVDSSGNITLVTTISGKAVDEAHAIALDSIGNIYIAGSTTSPNFPTLRPLQSTAASGTTGFIVKLSPSGGVIYATYFGGTMGVSSVNGIAVDSANNIYVTGNTTSTDFPHTAGLPASQVSNASTSTIAGAFFAKISSAGDRILYSGVLASNQHACGAGSTCFLSAIFTTGVAIAVDGTGSAYVAGNTFGTGLPTTGAALRASGIGAFVAKVNALGTAMTYVTLLGSANNLPGGAFSNSAPGNLVAAIAADDSGNAYISGSTTDSNFPVTAGAFQGRLAGIAPGGGFPPPSSDAFVAKLNPAGSAMVWATFLGGSSADAARTIAVDSRTNVWVSGTTSSNDFPAASGFPNGGDFLVEVASNGALLPFATRLPAQTAAAGLDVDSGGVVHMAGSSGLVSTLTPGETIAPRIFGIANAGGGVLAGRVVPGEVIAIYGQTIGPANATPAGVSPSGSLPTSLAGVKATINGVALPLLYVSSSQINAVAPVGLTSPGTTTLQLTNGPVSGLNLPLVIDATAPQVFKNVDSSAASINQDGTVNSLTAPAKPGDYVTIWATGVSGVPGPDGQVAAAAQQFCSCRIFSTTGTEALVTYAGTAPALVNGVVQINFQVPSGARGPATFYLANGGPNSDPFLIYVTP